MDTQSLIHCFAEAVIEGLRRSPKSISPKFLYDQRGSELFERICECPEYYVTRTETEILRSQASEIARLLGPGAVVFEFGSGASVKTRILLDQLGEGSAYVPIDISREFLIQASASLRALYPKLRILPVCADFTLSLSIPENELPCSGRRTGFFPGSTLGNFPRPEARALLRHIASFLGMGGLLLIGVDLLKPKEILEPAYDDAAGITAEFNLNLLWRMRRELGAEVDPADFRHRATFNEREGCIEMHLVSLRDQDFQVLGHTVHFARAETLHTECSYKHSPAQFEAMARHAGFSVLRMWTDSRKHFGVYLLEVDRLLEEPSVAA